MYVLWLNGTPMDVESMLSALKDAFGINLDAVSLNNQLADLERDSKIVGIAASSYKITEEEASSLESDVQTAQGIEDRVRQLFIDKVASECPQVDAVECWNEFSQRCLIPIVLEMGARTYEFLSNGTRPSDLSFEDTDFFAVYEPEIREKLRRIVLDFITPTDGQVRDYMLRTLNAAFFLEASGLSKETLTKLSSFTGGKKSLTLFLDTNLLFSILHLHDNPSNDVVNALLELIGEIKQTVSCSLYALPVTIEEFRNTVLANADELRRVRLPYNVAAAAHTSGRFSGVKLRYMRACAEVGGHIDPEDFFKPYAFNTLDVLRENGVELYNTKVDEYRTRQSAIDDINELWEYGRKEYRTDGRYRAIEHDVTLMHFVRDRRPEHVSSPLEAKTWFLTIDYHLLRYERSKDLNHRVCIDPSLLIQMLQFWLPRTEALETVMIESIRIPFAFRRFDAASERVAVRILETLSRYEVGDLSTRVITQVLMDDAVQASFGNTSDTCKEDDIVKEHLSSMDAALRLKVVEKQAEAEGLKALAEQRADQIGELKENMLGSSATVEELQKQLKDAALTISDRDQRLSDLQTQLSKSETSTTVAGQGANYLIKWVVLPAIAAALVVVSAGLLASALEVASAIIVTALVAAVATLVVLGLADWRGSKVRAIECEAWYLRLRRWRRWAYGLLGTLAIGLLTRYIWSLIPVLPQ